MESKLKLRLLGMSAVIALLIAGCSYASGNGRGMMGNSSYYKTPNKACSFPTQLPGTIIEVNLSDMGMHRFMGGIAPMGAHMRLVATPATVHAGIISIAVVNNGWRIHELVILPLAAGKRAGQLLPGGDGKPDETGSVGEASNDCGADVGKGIKPGSTSWTTIYLKPGRYEFICNLENHYVDGMYQEVDVV